MRTRLPSSQSFHRILRYVGIGTWAFLGLPAFDSATRRGYTLTDQQWSAWLGFFLVFGPAFWYSSTSSRRPPLGRAAALLIQTISTLGMTFLMQDYFVGFLLVIVSWQIALLLPLRVAVPWVLMASAVLLRLLEPHYYMGWRWGATGAFLGFQVFALVTAALAKSEAESVEDHARINAELVSTRELLRESSKLGERMRISRELHDSVGHNLTALCLHLEVALNSPAEEATDPMHRAHDAAKRALREVRAVVSTVQEGDGIHLREALGVLQQGLPRIRLHLSVSEGLRITDPARATAVLRCVQEIATNALKHSDAGNLWVDLRLDGGGIELDAHDDGRPIDETGDGFGLTSMRQRFEELGGSVSYELGTDRGFLVRARLPVDDEAR